MSLLTDDEIANAVIAAKVKCVHPNAETTRDVARAIEAAILAKLASAELPEPFHAGYIAQTEYFYTAAQLHQAFAQGAASQLSAVPSGFTTPDFCNIFFSEACAKKHGGAIPLFTLKESIL
jgi:hypothetical protein